MQRRFVSAVLASVKVRNLKVNHSCKYGKVTYNSAVLASMKVRNLKANHNLQYSGREQGDNLKN